MLCRTCQVSNPSKQIKGNNTLFFIKPSQILSVCKVIFCNFACTMQLNKSKVYIFRMTVGGDRLDAYQYVRSPAVNIHNSKVHINSTISDAHKGARYCTADIKIFSLFNYGDISVYANSFSLNSPEGPLWFQRICIHKSTKTCMASSMRPYMPTIR